MKPVISLIALLLAAVTAVHAETFTLNVGEFTRLKVEEGINVDYHRCERDSAGLVIFECDSKEVASVIGLTNQKQKLTVGFTTANENRLNIPTVHVYSSFLTAVENSGDSLVRVMSVKSCPEFKARQIGNGRIVVRDITATKVSASISTGRGTVVLYGKCDEAVLSMTGTGLLQADGLCANEVRVKTLGTGSVGCWPLRELKITGMGSTSVYYKGTPSISNKAVGVKVEPLP